MVTFHISSSENCPAGSMLLLTDPSKRTGSWGMIPNRDRRSCSPSMQISILSMIIFPAVGSTSLKKTWIKVDFPLPVRPTTPIFSPPLMLRVMPLSTRGVVGRYRTWRSLSSTLPWAGQFGGGRWLLLCHAASGWILENCFILSTETILFST